MGQERAQREGKGGSLNDPAAAATLSGTGLIWGAGRTHNDCQTVRVPAGRTNRC